MRARLITEITVDEYLEAEQESEVRHEYIYGEVFALAGASVTHNVICTNIVRMLVDAAGRDCRVYGSNMKLRADDRFYYPDAMIVCKPPADDFFETSPCVIIEVVSPSTARKDRLEKRFSYLALESLQLYLLIDSRKREVTGYYREPQGFVERITADDSVPVPCVGASLRFGELYDNVL